MTQTGAVAVRKQIVVDAPIERALIMPLVRRAARSEGLPDYQTDGHS